jgi:hypothetical protein
VTKPHIKKRVVITASATRWVEAGAGPEAAETLVFATGIGIGLSFPSTINYRGIQERLYRRKIIPSEITESRALLVKAKAAVPRFIFAFASKRIRTALPPSFSALTDVLETAASL